ncbi:c-type cytochrome [Helicobacter himalayensis]|uniref:c-type cytochrome n=1 Tax=Helicobacter himalayensis TaxID=1591088 RepID=UPI003D6E270F
MCKIMYKFLFCVVLFCAQILAQNAESSEQNVQSDDVEAIDSQSVESGDFVDSALDILGSKEEEFEGFISFKDYGKNLYKNPRGIGCDKCHGANGEGGIIASYMHKGKAKSLSAPSIKNLEFSIFRKALDSQKIGVMPNYYLTDKEIEAIYFYLYE